MGCSGPLGHRQWHWDSSASNNSCASIPVLIPFPCPVPVSGAAQGSRFTGWDGWRKPGQKGYVEKKVLWSFLGCPATTSLMRVEMTLGPSLLLNCAYLHALPPCFYLGSPFSLDVLPFPHSPRFSLLLSRLSVQGCLSHSCHQKIFGQTATSQTLSGHNQ